MTKEKKIKLVKGQTTKGYLTGKLVTKYLKKYPNMKDYTLAKLMYDENPQAFSSLDTARTSIRFRRGHMGKRISQDPTFITPKNYDTNNTVIKITNRAPKLKTLNLPINIKNVLFLTDIHIPYQDDLALNKAITYGLEKKVD